MAVVKIVNFGGILPAVTHRALPPNAATVASNLLARTPEFRPLLSATEYANVLGSTYNPATIYRLERTSGGALNDDPSTGWLAYSAPTVHARWPINDNATARTTVSSATGAYAPRVVNATGADRLLGVPAPTDAPTVSVTVGAYFTAEERAALMESLKSQMVGALFTGLTRAKIGADYTNNATEGYLEDGAEEAANPVLHRWRVHRYDAVHGTITDRYTAGDNADVAWLRSCGFGGWAEVGASGWPAWMGATGTIHYALDYPAYGAGWKFDAATAQAALEALDHVDSTQASAIASFYEDWFDPRGTQLSSVVNALRNAVADFEAYIDSRPTNAYDETTTDAKVDDLVEAAANQIYDALARNAGTYVVGGGT